MKNKRLWACICSALLLVACLLSGTLSKWAFTYRGKRIVGAAAGKDAEVKEISEFLSVIKQDKVEIDKSETVYFPINSATFTTSYSKNEVFDRRYF